MAYSYTWDVLAVEYYKNGRRMGDGDTLNLFRTTIQLLGDRQKRVTDLDFEAHRLAWVDTPEHNDPLYMVAANELTDWLKRKLAAGPLKVVCFGSAGWDRELCDLIASDGESASQWMMTQGNGGKGWPPYIKGQ